MEHGVTCARCGASTPLPADLRSPSFRCNACGGELVTAQYLKADIASAEQMRAYFQGVVTHAHGGAAPAPPPQLESTNHTTRAASCRHCGGAVAVPLALREKTFVCPTCKRTEPVEAYVSGKERFMLDMQRQIDGNRALAELRAAGVPCHRCGARNPVADPAAVQIVCTYCGAAILLSDHVSPDAVARARLKQGLVEMRAGLAGAQKKQDRFALILLGCIVAVVAVGVTIVLVVR